MRWPTVASDRASEITRVASAAERVSRCVASGSLLGATSAILITSLLVHVRGATARLGGPAVLREPESYGERKKARPSHAMTACGRACVVSTSVLLSLPRPRLLKPGSRARARGGRSAPRPDSYQRYQLPAIPATPATASSSAAAPEQESSNPDHQDHDGYPPEDV